MASWARARSRRSTRRRWILSAQLSAPAKRVRELSGSKIFSCSRYTSNYVIHFDIRQRSIAKRAVSVSVSMCGRVYFCCMLQGTRATR